MADVPHVQLKDFFKLFAPTYVLGTTYTLSLAFFEGIVYPEIKRLNLRRCMILCDKVGFQRATIESSALRSVGREYMAICAPARRSFHPKVWVMIAEGKTALLVGSGNLTQSGFMDNTELFEVVQLEAGGPHHAVVDDIVRFLAGLRSMWSGNARRLLAIETLEEMERELTDLGRQMPDDPAPDLRFMSNFDRPFIEQFKDLFRGGTLQVAAPYFGGTTQGIRLLQEQLAPNKVRVFPAVHPRNELDVGLSDLQTMTGVSVSLLRIARGGPFAHLKLYGFDSERGQWLFTTSANCTVAALGEENVEAGLLRRVDRAILDEYFTKALDVPLPHAQRADVFLGGTGWLTFWATDRGQSIELVVSDATHRPLTNLIATITVSGLAESHPLQSLFSGEPIGRIEWSLFSEIPDRKNHPVLVSLEATDSAGKRVHGDALLDDPLLLSSDPTHRSAWRAAMSLLESEGLPDSADIACIFHLVENVFEAEEEKSPDDGLGIGTPPRSRSEIPDKVPIWPPVAYHESLRGFAGNSRLHDLQWFQKILSLLLNPGNENEVTTSATPADSMDDEGATQTKQALVKSQSVKSIWKQVTTSHQRLQAQFSHLVLTVNSARKIWPIATAVFLVTLVTRRQLLEHSDPMQGIPPATELVRDFLRMLFVERPQSSDYHPPTSCRYRYSTFPSIAGDLLNTFDSRPSDDIAGILLLMFGYWHVAEKRQGRGIPVNAWLQFREIAGSIANGIGVDRDTIRAAFGKYIFDDLAGIAWSEIEVAFQDLANIDWPSYEGYRALRAILNRAGGHPPGNDFPPHLEDRWSQTERRIQAQRSWRYAVDLFSETCAANDCKGQYIRDPKKKKDLGQCSPTICSSCGAVLIPDRLWRAYEEIDGQDS
jgi:hypothetical protein